MICYHRSNTLLLYAWSTHFKHCSKSFSLYEDILLLLTAIYSLPMVISPTSFDAPAIIVGIFSAVLGLGGGAQAQLASQGLLIAWRQTVPSSCS